MIKKRFKSKFVLALVLLIVLLVVLFVVLLIILLIVSLIVSLIVLLIVLALASVNLYSKYLLNNLRFFLNSFFDVIRQGDKYLQDWPKKKVLNCLFVDSKIAFYTRLSIKVIPAFIFLIIALNIVLPTFFSWSVTLTFILFLLGLPVQGLYWLGKRSQELLPSQLLPWYIAIQEKLYGNRSEQKIMQYRPSYRDLALLLKNVFKIGGDKFLQHHELI